MSETAKFKRDCYCGEAALYMGGGTEEKQVSVCGFAATVRDKGGVIFIDLRDRTGVVQLVFDDTTAPAVFGAAKTVKTEYVLSVSGVLRKRAVANPNVRSGAVEVFVTRLDILSLAERPPFEICGEAVKDDIKTGEDVRLRYRYLDLRRSVLAKNIILRHEIAKTAREYFYANGFLEIETPMMMKSTPEGARDYLVPSRVHQGRFYALPQSPQIYKQLLMVAGYDRYIQLARCFRDEDLRADRQPEFTQIDLEMSFVDTDDIIAMLEGFIEKLMRDVKGEAVTLPLPRLTYDEAMRRYGSDKPDTRYCLEIADVTAAVSGIDGPVFKPRVTEVATVGEYTVNALVIPDSAAVLTRKEIDRHIDFIKGIGGSGAAFVRYAEAKPSSSFNKFVSEEQLLQLCKDIGLQQGGVAFIGVNEGVIDGKGGKYLPVLGSLRTRIAKQLGLIPEHKFNFVWVTEFPFFEYDPESGAWNAMHHPFTMPLDDNLKYLGATDSATDVAGGDGAANTVQYEKIYAKAYDLVLNGTELLSGSIRITDAALQRRMFEILGLTEDEIAAKFGFLVEAYRYGAPPHGGAGIGLDRLAMVLSAAESLRDVIAFPKIKDGSEPMSGSPGEVDTAQLDDLGLALRK